MTPQQARDYNILLEIKERVESKYKNRINIVNKMPRVIFVSNIEENKISDEAKQRAKNYMSLKGALEPKQETLEEAAEIWINNRFTKQICGDKSYPDIYASKKSIIESHIIFAKSQAERMYSEEDMIEFAEWCANSHYHYYFDGEKWSWGNSHKQHYCSTRELLQLWKEQQPKT